MDSCLIRDVTRLRRRACRWDESRPSVLNFMCPPASLAAVARNAPQASIVVVVFAVWCVVCRSVVGCLPCFLAVLLCRQVDRSMSLGGWVSFA